MHARLALDDAPKGTAIRPRLTPGLGPAPVEEIVERVFHLGVAEQCPSCASSGEPAVELVRHKVIRTDLLAVEVERADIAEWTERSGVIGCNAFERTLIEWLHAYTLASFHDVKGGKKGEQLAFSTHQALRGIMIVLDNVVKERYAEAKIWEDSLEIARRVEEFLENETCFG